MYNIIYVHKMYLYYKLQKKHNVHYTNSEVILNNKQKLVGTR